MTASESYNRNSSRNRDALVAGVDEAGRGPLAGPVVAAAVVLDRRQPIAGLDDSKALTSGQRERLASDIRSRSLAWALGWSDAAEIDAVNILQATFLAMRRALLGLRVRPSHVLVDGNRLPALDFFETELTGEAIIRGDQSVAAISAASILAKTCRDSIMLARDSLYPQYGFAQHKGYPTAAHRDCLAAHGPCPEHRFSFAPLKNDFARRGAC